MRELKFSEPLKTAYSPMVSQHLWTSPTSFCFPHFGECIVTYGTSMMVDLCTVQLYEESLTCTLKKRPLDPLLRQIFDCPSRTTFVKYLGNFCTIPESSCFYFVSHCPNNHEHSRLLFVDKKTLTIDSFLDISGSIAFIVPTKTELLIAKRLNPSIFFQNESIWTYIGISNNSFSSKEFKCPFGDPWRISHTVDQKLIKLERTDLDGNNYKFLSELEDIVQRPPLPTSLTFRQISQTRNYLDTISFFDNCSYTKDFLCVTHSDTETKTFLYSRNHAFQFICTWKCKYEYKAPAFLHPTLPIVLTKTNFCKSLRICMLKTATDDEKLTFPKDHDHCYKSPLYWILK